jgi:hypothetical protein
VIDIDVMKVGDNGARYLPIEKTLHGEINVIPSPERGGSTRPRWNVKSIDKLWDRIFLRCCLPSPCSQKRCCDHHAKKACPRRSYHGAFRKISFQNEAAKHALGAQSVTKSSLFLTCPKCVSCAPRSRSWRLSRAKPEAAASPFCPHSGAEP